MSAGVPPTTVASSIGPSRTGAATAEAAAGGASTPTARPPAHQRYDLLGEHGRGGLGVVMRARDTELGRQVAIKQLLRRGAYAEARFLREALITARLEHPSIVPVHEAGRWPDGTPFFAMKLVSGRPLAELIAAAATPADRLGLLPHVIAVADAIAYAHVRRIIHRDLKPSNVLVGDFGETVVIDWGLAKDLHAVDDDPVTGDVPSLGVDLTEIGSVMGTPAYMAPEQARGAAVDERADVFALGAILFELVTGRPPGADVADPAAIGRVLERASVPADLQTIIAKAVASAPRDRYPSAGPLVEDLRRYDRGARVAVHRYSWRSLAARFVRRHRLLVASSAAFLALLALGATLSVRRIRTERDIAVAAQAVAVAERNRVIRIHAESALATDPTSALAWLGRLPAEELETAESRQVALLARALGVATAVLEVGVPVPYLTFTPDGTQLVTCGSGALALWGTDGSRLRTTRGECFSSLPIAPDGSRVYASGSPGGLIEWDLQRDEVRVAYPTGLVVEPILLARDGGLVAGLADGSVLHAPPGAMPALAPWPRVGHARVLSNAGGWLASIDPAGDPWLTEVATGRQTRLSGASPVRLLRFATGDRTLVILRADGSVSSVALGDGAFRQVAWDVPATESLSVGEGIAALVHRNDSVSLWDVRGRTRLAELSTVAAPSMSRVSPDDAWVAVGSKSGPVLVHERATGRGIHLRGHRSRITNVRFQPGGRLVATASHDGTVRLWPLPDTRFRRLGNASEMVRQLAIAPGGAQVASAGDRGSLHLYPLGGGPAPIARSGHQPITAVVYSPSGDRVAARYADGQVVVSDARTGEVTDRLDGVAIKDVAFAPDGASVALAQADGYVIVRALSGGHRRVVGTHRGEARWIRFLDQHVVVAASSDGVVVAWDLRDGRQPIRYEHAGGVLLMDVVTGPRLVTSGADGSLVVWSRGTEPVRVAGLTRARAFAVSPRGTRLMVADAGGELQLRALDAVSRPPLAVVRFPSPMIGVCFVDEDTVVGASDDGALLVWRDGVLVDLWTTDRSGNTALACTGGADGHSARLVTATRDGDVVSWPLASRGRPASVRALIDEALAVTPKVH